MARFDTPQFSADFDAEPPPPADHRAGHQPRVCRASAFFAPTSPRTSRSSAPAFANSRSRCRRAPASSSNSRARSSRKSASPPPKEGRPEVWTLVFQKRIRGAYRLDVMFDTKFQDDAWSARSRRVSIPEAQEQGFVVVHSSATTAITVARDGCAKPTSASCPRPRAPAARGAGLCQQPFDVMMRAQAS